MSRNLSRPDPVAAAITGPVFDEYEHKLGTVPAGLTLYVVPGADRQVRIESNLSELGIHGRGFNDGYVSLAGYVGAYNPNLFAAAPDLLEALRVAKEAIRAWHGPNEWDIYDRASPEMKAINSAIAKAEGRS